MGKGAPQKLNIKIVTLFVIIAGALLAGFFAMDYLRERQDAAGAPCGELPTLQELEKSIAAHQDGIAAVANLGGEVTWGGEYAEINGQEGARCPGKGDVLILYGTVSQRDRIKKYLGGTFYGIPYRMANV